MNKKSKNDPSTEQINARFNQACRLSRYNHRGIKPHKFSGVIPSPMEVATLAAMLAKTSQESQENLCAAALNLWFVATETISLQEQCNKDYALMDAEREADQQKLPTAKNSEFPMKLDLFCKKMWPEKNTADRAMIFKEWQSSVTKTERWLAARDAGEESSPIVELTKDEITKLYSAARKEPIDKQRFSYLRGVISDWYKKYNEGKISKARSDAALKRHEREADQQK